IIKTYENDPWQSELYWPEGLAQLTNIGRQQAHELGDYLRRRYSKLLANNGSYHRNTIYVQSSDLDRTLMTAAHVLAGMFPPKDHQIWNESLLWQAIPIHTLPQDQDGIIATKRPCPKYAKAFDDYEESDEIQSIIKSNRTLFDYLEKYVGQKVKTICKVKTIYQALWVESLKNFPLPDWTSKVFYPDSDMNKLANFCFKIKTNTNTLARLKSGFFLREMLDRFTQKMNNSLTPNRNLWIYSGHDTTIASLLNALGLFEKPHIPIYASC
ncbi:testicular acid phosphatase homolog, partial [Contarinia nasturtii]|uniref:testicular acid phosphatase homolog n=1 Tax=Contarinia nasturtii TaxID=265458 RepID=UPI0012D3AC52